LNENPYITADELAMLKKARELLQEMYDRVKSYEERGDEEFSITVFSKGIYRTHIGQASDGILNVLIAAHAYMHILEHRDVY
jgi:hypothetical protein